jgi:hypothetical protein
MSLSSRKSFACTAAGLTLLGSAGGAAAAQVWYQPIAVLSTAYNTNVDLDPGTHQSAEGYFADVATNIDIATPTSENLFEPRLLYNYYPTATYRNRLEGFLNMYSRYEWQRDRFTLGGFFDHRDDVNANQPAAETNDVNPGLGDNPTTNQKQVGTVRNYLILDPTYTHLLTPLSSIGIAGEYQGIRYSPAEGQTDFNFYQGRLFYSRTINLRTDVSIGAYGSEYRANTTDSRMTSEGAQLSGGFNWTQVLRSELIVQWQHSKFDEPNTDHASQSTVSPWAASLSTTYKQQISSYRFSIGRTIYPSSAGTLYTVDQVQGQYERHLTQRLRFIAALRVFRDNSTIGSASERRDYATTNIRAEYMLTPTIFVAGGYSHVYQKYQSQLNSADANIASIQFGYRGLGRPQ